jgi:hypothetical protein
LKSKFSNVSFLLWWELLAVRTPKPNLEREMPLPVRNFPFCFLWENFPSLVYLLWNPLDFPPKFQQLILSFTSSFQPKGKSLSFSLLNSHLVAALCQESRWESWQSQILLWFLQEFLKITKTKNTAVTSSRGKTQAKISMIQINWVNYCVKPCANII